ncbi:MAG: 2-oxo acid dehydrogenase subunit E2 [Pirellulaceae bacterium]
MDTQAGLLVPVIRDVPTATLRQLAARSRELVEKARFSLTFDHRLVDGAPAARFLDDVRKRIESPSPWLMQ